MNSRYIESKICAEQINRYESYKQALIPLAMEMKGDLPSALEKRREKASEARSDMTEIMAVPHGMSATKYAAILNAPYVGKPNPALHKPKPDPFREAAIKELIDYLCIPSLDYRYQ